MSCRIDYIEELPLTGDQEKARLTKMHIDLARAVNNHRVQNGNYTSKIFQHKNDKLVVPGNGVYYKDALRLIGILNQDVGFEAVKLVEDPTNANRRFVSIDVRPDRSEPLEPETEEQMQTFYKNTLGDSEIVTGSLEFEDVLMDAEHEKTWKRLTESVAEKAKRYLGGLEKSGDYYRSGKTEKDLKFLLATLNDDSAAGLMESVSKYIVMSGFNLGNIRSRLATIEKKITTLSTDPETRKQQLKEVADFTRHSTYFYHLFDLLSDMSNEFSTMGLVPRAIDNYERDLLERDVRALLVEDGLMTEDEMVDFMNIVPSEVNDIGSLYRIYRAMYQDKLGDVTLPAERWNEIHDRFNDVFTQNLKPNGSIQQQLDNILKQLRPLKMGLKKLHYDVLTEVYYPSFQDSFKGKESDLTIDGKSTIGAKYLMPKDKFRLLLQQAEEDISAVEKWGSAMINSSDVVATTVANFFKEVMIDIDLTNKSDIEDFQTFLTKNGRSQGDSVLKETDAQAVHLNNTIEAVEQVDDTYVPKQGDSVIELTVLGRTNKYRARVTKNYLNKFNNIAYQNTKKVFQSMVGDVAEEYATQMLADRYALDSLRNSGDPVLQNLHSMLYVPSPAGDMFLSNHMGRFFMTEPTVDELKDKLQAMMYTSFYTHHLRNKDAGEVNDMFIEYGVTDGSGKLKDLNLPENYKAKAHVLENSNWNSYKVYTRGQITSSNLNDRFHFNPMSLFGEGTVNSKRVLVRFTDYSLGYVEVITDPNTKGVILNNNTTKDIDSFASFSGDYTSLNDSYDIEKGAFGKESQAKWEAIQKDPFKKEYFNKIINLYKQANRNYVQISLTNREVPQVNKMDESTKLSRAKTAMENIKAGQGQQMFEEYAKTYQVEEDKIPLMKNGGFVDEEGNPVNDPIYVSTERQYINGQKIRGVTARYNRPIPLDNIETDLYKSILMYKTASNSYRGLKNNESQALLLQSVLEGDETLGLKKRVAKVKKYGKDVMIPGGGVKYKEHELRTSTMIVSFINDYVFGISNEDFGLLGSKVSAKRVAGMISGYTAFTALAWNAFTIPSNRLISMHNTRVVAEGNEFFNEQDWRDSIAIYHKNLGGFFNDFKTKGFTNQKSDITQMAIRFNAIQGEFLSPQGLIQTEGLSEKLSENALYWTQQIGEHANQIESMIMLMKGYKIPDSNGGEVSLWKAIEDVNKGRPKGEALIMPQEFSRELEIDFQKRLQGVNRQIHGNYGKLDKNMMQKGVMTNMLMTFKKYIYDGFRSRFQEERYDQEIRDEQEGYFRTYLKAMNEEFSETAKTQGLTAALKSSGAKSLGRTLLKTTLGAWDAATFRLVSGGKDSTSDIAKWLYGEKGTITDRQYYAAMKATYDVGNMVRAMLLIVAVEAIMSGLDEDDEELKFILSYVEIYAQKMESDIGLFTSFTNAATGPFVGGATLDQMYRLWKAPMAATRSIDTTTQIFKQLISFDAMDEEGNLEFRWRALDQYEKSGDGYEKGDYKIMRKFQKSIFAPWWQVLKLLSPQEQLEYMTMVNKYSQ